jgi:hypothetical protein
MLTSFDHSNAYPGGRLVQWFGSEPFNDQASLLLSILSCISPLASGQPVQKFTSDIRFSVWYGLCERHVGPKRQGTIAEKSVKHCARRLGDERLN